MRTIAYSTILEAVARRMGWDPDLLDKGQFGSIRQAVSQALGEAWYAAWWRDLMRIEQRKFRATYSASTAYVLGDEVWDPATDSYKQALRATTGNAPSTAGSDGSYSTNLAYWADVVREPSGTDYSATASYAPGDIVRFPDDAQFYQCHTATTGHAPTSTAYWGLLSAFRPYVAWDQAGANRIGRCRKVMKNDPRAAVGERRIIWNPSDEGVEVFTLDVPRPWIQFVQPAPKFIGDYYDSSISYTPETVYGAPSTPSVSSDFIYFVTIAEAQAATISARVVEVRYNANSESATFVRDPAYTGPADGVAGFTDASGTKFALMR